jgi:DNA polymerase III subunit delta'
MQLQLLPWHQQNWSALAEAIRQQRLAHALLLVGPRGVGKRHFAALLSQTLLCTQQPATNGMPCGRCHACALIKAGTHPDLHRLEKEEGSKVVKVDDVREFNRRVFLTPSSDRGNVGIIDPVDGLNRSSANALLKSLEEPPAGTHILLIGERWQSLPATLRSRCLTVRFPIPDAQVVRTWLTAHSTATSNSIHDPLRARYQPDMARQRTWMEALTSLCTGKIDPVQLAESWQKPDEELPDLVDWLHDCIVDMLKLKHGLGPDKLKTPDYLTALSAIAGRITTNDLLELARRNLDGKRLVETQAKPQMLLENMLASWYQSSMSTAATAKKGAGIR